MSLLDVDNLSLSLDGSAILNGLSFDLWEGYVHAIVGPNGAGKSTLAFALMGLDGYRHIDGDIRLDGESIRGLSVDERARRGMTLGWQEPARFEGLPLRRFIACGADGADDETITEAMQQVGLDPARYLGRAVDTTLSGGERKKVELASILAMRPRLVLLDEPDSGIDVDSLHRIHDAIGLLRDAGTTVVLITHSMEVLGWAQHAFLICCGNIVDKGPSDEIVRYFRNKCIPCDHKNAPTLAEMP
ncbi:MAG: ABC transporter ATP-binding protein [Phycisphaerae bacterium]|nr:ABC transporter ATP-binding protein [Phycisphaerae bacterium]